MSNSVQAVKDKLKNVSREKNVDFNSVMSSICMIDLLNVYQKVNIKIILY